VEQVAVDDLWSFVQLMVDVTEPLAPEVYFAGEDEPGMSGQFLAYYYERTNVLRVSQSAHRRQDGYPYLVVAHEMQHYALRHEVPLPDHHCRFAERRYWQMSAAYLVGRGLVYPYLVRIDGDRPCETKETTR